MTTRGWVLFVAMGLIWGVPYLLIKVAVAEVSPATLVFLRTTLGALLLLPVAALRGGLRPLLRAWRVVLLYTLVEVTLPWFFLSDAERRLSSSLTGLLVAAVPLVGLALALLTRSDARLDERRLAGLITGFVGVAVLLGLDVSAGDLGAVGEVGLVIVGYSIGPILIARRLSQMPSVGVVAASLALTALFYAPPGLSQLGGNWPSQTVLGALAILSVVCTALAFVLFFALIAEVGPVRAQMITYVNPAVAVGLGVAVLGEPLTLGTVLGFLLIVLGLWLGAYGKRSSATVENPVPSAGATLTDTVAEPPRRGVRSQSVAGTMTE